MSIKDWLISRLGRVRSILHIPVLPPSSLAGGITGLVLVASACFAYTNMTHHSLVSRPTVGTKHTLVTVPKNELGSTITPTPTIKPPSPSQVALAPSIAPIVHVPPPAPSAFVSVCNLSLCSMGAPFYFHGATAYGTYDDPASEVSLAQSAKLNTLELVEFDTQYHVLSDAMSEATWTRVDKFVALAKLGGLRVVLNLSEYGQSLQAAGRTPTTVGWGPYLSFIANRVNTVTGVEYKNDPTIAMTELFGEICYPGETDSTCPAGTSGSASDMTSFFHRSETEWSALAPNIMVSSGGFSHLNGNTSIPWQQIVSDPANAICDMEINSSDDVSLTTSKFTSFCKSLSKPWFLAAWSSCFNSPSYPFHTSTDAAMSAHAADMYSISKGNTPAAYPSVGADFWNLRDEGATVGTCSIGPSFPVTWSQIRSTAP